jgi:exodeoxyribonuclease-3
MVKVVTWNVNSIAMRVHQLIELIELEKPDVIFLQEIKCQSEQFQHDLLGNLDYKIFVHGQKAYNGVAIMVKNNFDDPELVHKSFSDQFEDESRYIEVTVKIKNKKISFASVYVPNGQAVTSEKFPYKLEFLKKLRKFIANKTIIIGGDFNVAPYDIDIKNPDDHRNTLGFHPLEQKEIREFYDLGFYDPLRFFDKEECFSWWDYRRGGWEKNNGMRIDYFLISSDLTKYAKNAYHLKDFRTKEKPSDHIPVICELEI